jgi:hypothetical protein
MSGAGAMLPLPPDAGRYRDLLFNLEFPMFFDQTQFNRYWPLVDNIYTHRKTGKTSKGKETLYYECRLVKSRVSQSKLYLALWTLLIVIRNIDRCMQRQGEYTTIHNRQNCFPG